MSPEACPNCGADVPRKAKACPECGADETIRLVGIRLCQRPWLAGREF